MQWRAMGGFDPLFAGRALQEAENDSRPWPPLLHFFQNAVEVEHMFALKHHSGGAPKPTYVADRAVGVFILLVGSPWIFFNAALLETRQAAPFPGETIAGMPTCQHLITTLFHEVDALVFPADVLESRFGGRRGLASRNLVIAVPALSGIFFMLELFTCLAQVVGLGLAGGAEVVLAGMTPDSVLPHMLRCLS